MKLSIVCRCLLSKPELGLTIRLVYASMASSMDSQRVFEQALETARSDSLKEVSRLLSDPSDLKRLGALRQEYGAKLAANDQV